MPTINFLENGRKNRCLWNTNAPLPKHIKNRLDLDLSPTNLNFDKGHLLIKDYLPTKFETSGANHSWITNCTRCGRPTWPLTTDLKINRDHLLIMDYLPTKVEPYGAKRPWLRCTRCGIPTWPLTFQVLTSLSIGIIYLSRTIYLPTLKFLIHLKLEKFNRGRSPFLHLAKERYFAWNHSAIFILSITIQISAERTCCKLLCTWA